MVELHTIYAMLYAGVVVLASTVAFIALRHRAARGAMSIAAVMLGVAVWSVGLTMMWYVPGREQQIFWLRVMSLGTWVIPVAVLTLAFDLTGMERWRTPGRIAVIAGAFFALNNLEWFNPGGLYDAGFTEHMIGTHTHFTVVPGPLYWAFVAATYIVVTVALVILSLAYLHASRDERRQMGVVLIGATVPFAVGVLTQLRPVPLEFDFVPVAFLVTGALWLAEILRGTLLDILPLARTAVVEQMLDGVLVIDGERNVADANPAAVAMLGLPLAEALGRSAETLFSTIEGAASLLRGGGGQRGVLSFGSRVDARSVELRVAPLTVGLGRPPAQLVTLHDVTDERRARDDLLLARRVFDAANEAIVVTLPDSGDEIIDVNGAYSRLTGRSKEQVVGEALGRFRSERHPPEFYEAIERVLLTSGEWKGEVWQTRADGTAFRSLSSLSVAEDAETNVRHVVSLLTDITDAWNAEERLRFSATHDSLTGLPNRILFNDRLMHALAQARRAGTFLAVVFLDLDNFKSVNDTLGHNLGDELLVQVAQRIVSVFREGDTVGRLGGDEFTVVVNDIGSPANAEISVGRLLKAFEPPFRLGGADLRVTASIGVALFPADGGDEKTLIQHADLAMYGAKGIGPGRIQFFSEELQHNLERRVTIEQELRGADEEGRYFLLYQPQVDLATGLITGVEALVRLRSQDGAVLSPVEFIPVAENSELILKLGDWVVRKACDDLVAFHEVSPELTMSVNFSAYQVRRIDIVSLQDVLRECGVNPRHMTLEITETALTTDLLKAARNLDELRDVAGMRVSLDDFGTGYSPLTYVRMFRADTIKIDRSFVALLPDDLEGQTIVLSTIALAKGLHATVIAEGPETEEQVRFLRANGCDCAQGFYFSRPVPADELMQLLQSGPFVLPEL